MFIFSHTRDQKKYPTCFLRMRGKLQEFWRGEKSKEIRPPSIVQLPAHAATGSRGRDGVIVEHAYALP